MLLVVTPVRHIAHLSYHRLATPPREIRVVQRRQKGRMKPKLQDNKVISLNESAQEQMGKWSSSAPNPPCRLQKASLRLHLREASIPSANIGQEETYICYRKSFDLKKKQQKKQA